MVVRIPGRVFDDYLDEKASGMAAALGLPEPGRRKAGKGWSYWYVVSAAVAEELGRYLAGRAETLLGQGITDPYDPFEKRERDVHRAALRVAEQIREAV